MSKTTASILIVEDEAFLRDAYKLILETAGHQVHTASNGLEGLKKLSETQPDIILLDVFMPVLDGREFLKNFDRGQHPDIRIIVCSNMSDSKVQDEVLSLGADDFVLKSDMGPADLLSRVAKHTSR